MPAKLEFIVQGNYSCGWEDVDTADTMREAKASLWIYEVNETQYSHRVITRRIKIA